MREMHVWREWLGDNCGETLVNFHKQFRVVAGFTLFVVVNNFKRWKVQLLPSVETR